MALVASLRTVQAPGPELVSAYLTVECQSCHLNPWLGFTISSQICLAWGFSADLCIL
ncbi:hypothetical protein AG1IA_03434 [Rhizoctonia solani AG-1 IA]|uniref:Uncharacterized protein n=1 Tax=Thanatephorus cucumeris (strain AG1-IA) TaxID=983506 RepID=L8X1P7_THACA|nr:hypothetical protein AG1IA_03434 [Rhizoctonia solani AG-1 IA]